MDSDSVISPNEEKGLRRVEEENWLRSQDWSTLIIRPAAIYGPGRGIHLRVRDGKAPRAAGAGLVSRVHVDDLAAVLEAGVFSELTGAWPLADHLPATTDNITDWCVRLLGVQGKGNPAPAIQTSGRSVSGEGIRGALKIKAAYPEYAAGILASLASEADL